MANLDAIPPTSSYSANLVPIIERVSTYAPMIVRTAVTTTVRSTNDSSSKMHSVTSASTIGCVTTLISTTDQTKASLMTTSHSMTFTPIASPGTTILPTAVSVAKPAPIIAPFEIPASARVSSTDLVGVTAPITNRRAATVHTMALPTITVPTTIHTMILKPSESSKMTRLSTTVRSTSSMITPVTTPEPSTACAMTLESTTDPVATITPMIDRTTTTVSTMISGATTVSTKVCVMPSEPISSPRTSILSTTVRVTTLEPQTARIVTLAPTATPGTTFIPTTAHVTKPDQAVILTPITPEPTIVRAVTATSMTVLVATPVSTTSSMAVQDTAPGTAFVPTTDFIAFPIPTSARPITIARKISLKSYFSF